MTKHRFKFLHCLLISTWVAGFFAGCQTTPKVDWTSRVGIFTYDQAVVELGPPDRSATLADGVIVAEWLTQHGSSYGMVSTLPGFYIHHYDATTSPDRFLRLTFDKGGRLREWKRVWR
jgi:hypothetical protein